MPLSDMPGWVTNLVSAIGGIGVGGYTLTRIYRRDSNSDALDNKSQKLIDNLTHQIEYERETNIRLGQTIDRLSSERNEAVQNVGRLEGQITVLQAAVEHLQSEVIKLEKINETLAFEVNTMREEFSAMRTSLSRSVE